MKKQENLSRYFFQRVEDRQVTCVTSLVDLAPIDSGDDGAVRLVRVSEGKVFALLEVIEEFDEVGIKLFGRNRRHLWARVLMWPGMQLQRLTTREPDLTQLAVAIAALEAVLSVERPEDATEEERIGMEVVA